MNCLLCKKMFLKKEDFEKHNCVHGKKGDKPEVKDIFNIFWLIIYLFPFLSQGMEVIGPRCG